MKGKNLSGIPEKRNAIIVFVVTLQMPRNIVAFDGEVNLD
jgi:hypothetical protein